MGILFLTFGIASVDRTITNILHPSKNFLELFLRILRTMGILAIFARPEISFCPISQKISPLGHKLLHKLYINVAFAIIFLYWKSLYDVPKPRYEFP